MLHLSRSKRICYLTIFRHYASDRKTVSSLDYCTNILSASWYAIVNKIYSKDRQHDYENFLSTLLLSKALRSPAIILRAFNVEVARVQDQTTDSRTAAFRLQFWQETLDKIFIKGATSTSIPENPVAQELFKICQFYNLPKRRLEKLISSRRNFLNVKYFKSLEDVEKYSEDSISSIYYLLYSIVKLTNVNADHAASHLGKAQGITNTLRSIHVSNHHKVVPLPMDILMKYGVSQESVLRGVDNAEIRNVVFDVASRAHTHLKKARGITVPDAAKQLLLPAIAIDSYLKKLEKCDFNVYDKSLHLGSGLLPFQLYLKRLVKKY